MEKHEEKYCPKCGKSFTCKVGDITNCQCNIGPLADVTRNFLSKTDFDCLCKECLTKINNDLIAAKGYQFPTQKEMLLEGLHFYEENGNWVFTELYHLLRGYCCKNGCRHCVYGFRQKMTVDG